MTLNDSLTMHLRGSITQSIVAFQETLQKEYRHQLLFRLHRPPCNCNSHRFALLHKHHHLHYRYLPGHMFKRIYSLP